MNNHVCSDEQNSISLNIGLEPSIVVSISEAISMLDCRSGYSFLVAQVIHPRLGHHKGIEGIPFARSDLDLTTEEWRNVMATVDAGKLLQNNDAYAEEDFEEYLNFTRYLSIEKIIVRIPCEENMINIGIPLIARILHKKMLEQSLVAQTFIATFPMIDGSWEKWNALRIMCDLDRQLMVGLELNADCTDSENISRWLAEPVGVISIPTKLFLTNKAGFPVLPRKIQIIVKRFLKRPGIGYIVQGECRHNNISDYSLYIQHLHNTNESLTVIEAFESSFEDYIQTPLQPLADSLESQIYETFEKDKIKYEKYQLAISEALQDLRNSSDTEKVVFVLGAGRGPLVRCVMNAAKANNMDVVITAVEKNSGCINTLSILNETDWERKVNVIKSDFRAWNPGFLADLIVSELIGSFGDNELCPECLDETSRLLKENGINIPQDNISFLAPVHAPRAYSEVSKMGDLCRGKHDGSIKWSKFEVPYVVAFGCCMNIDEPKEAFKFVFPNRKGQSNERFVSLSFDCNQDLLLTGFGGYFSAKLYKDIYISTVSGSRTKDMTSWFSMFFPIKTPVQLRSGDKISFNMWRKVDTHQVWYEWLLTEPVSSVIHNSNANCYRMLL